MINELILHDVKSYWFQISWCKKTSTTSTSYLLHLFNFSLFCVLKSLLKLRVCEDAKSHWQQLFSNVHFQMWSEYETMRTYWLHFRIQIILFISIALLPADLNGLLGSVITNHFIPTCQKTINWGNLVLHFWKKTFESSTKFLWAALPHAFPQIGHYGSLQRTTIAWTFGTLRTSTNFTNKI